MSLFIHGRLTIHHFLMLLHHVTMPIWMAKLMIRVTAHLMSISAVIPTLPMFLLFPYLLPKLGFWLTTGASVLLTIICFGLFVLVMKGFGIDLL
jgi:hypothetical protein